MSRQNRDETETLLFLLDQDRITQGKHSDWPGDAMELWQNAFARVCEITGRDDLTASFDVIDSLQYRVQFMVTKRFSRRTLCDG